MIEFSSHCDSAEIRVEKDGTFTIENGQRKLWIVFSRGKTFVRTLSKSGKWISYKVDESGHLATETESCIGRESQIKSFSDEETP